MKKFNDFISCFISFYFCFDKDNSTPKFVVVYISNKALFEIFLLIGTIYHKQLSKYLSKYLLC